MNFNPFMVWLLRSPFHGLLSRSTLVLRVKGVRSGRIYDVPVNFLQIEEENGPRFLVISQRDRTWWRNLRDRVEIDLTYRGRTRKAKAHVEQADDKVAEGLQQFFRSSPQSARYFGVTLDDTGEITSVDLDRLVSERVVVWIDMLALSP